MSVFEQTHNHSHLIQTETMQSCQSETFHLRIANILYFPYNIIIYYSRLKIFFNKTKNSYSRVTNYQNQVIND